MGKYTKTTLISRDSKLNSEEEEKVKLIITPEKDCAFKTKINITPPNIDLFPDSPITKLSVKLSMPLSKVTRLLLKLNPLN